MLSAQENEFVTRTGPGTTLDPMLLRVRYREPTMPPFSKHFFKCFLHRTPAAQSRMCMTR
jgi:hypothetical protein